MASCEWEGEEVCEGAVTRDKEGSRLLQVLSRPTNQLGSSSLFPLSVKGEWSVAERTTFMEYLCNERS